MGVWLGGACDSHAQPRYTPVAERCYMLALTVSEIAQEDRLMYNTVSVPVLHTRCSTPSHLGIGHSLGPP